MDILDDMGASKLSAKALLEWTTPLRPLLRLKILSELLFSLLGFFLNFKSKHPHFWEFSQNFVTRSDSLIKILYCSIYTYICVITCTKPSITAAFIKVHIIRVMQHSPFVQSLSVAVVMNHGCVCSVAELVYTHDSRDSPEQGREVDLKRTGKEFPLCRWAAEAPPTQRYTCLRWVCAHWWRSCRSGTQVSSINIYSNHLNSVNEWNYGQYWVSVMWLFKRCVCFIIFNLQCFQHLSHNFYPMFSCN